MNANDEKTVKVDSVAIFFDAEKLKDAIDDLTAIGVTEEQIGILCTEDSLRAKLSQVYRISQKGNSGENSPNVEFVDDEAVGVTAYAALGGLTFVAAAVGGGALIASAAVLGGALAVATSATAVVGGLGAVAAGLMSKSDAEALQEQLDAGHILLFVRTGETKQKNEVLKVLKMHSAISPRTLEPETVAV